MNCPKCNSPINEKKKFCTKCGENIEEYIKQEKNKKKEERAEKFYKVKVKVALVLLVIFIILVLVFVGLNFFGKKSHKTGKYENTENTVNTEEISLDGGLTVPDFELTEENKDLDYDGDGLKNEEEIQYGTSVISSDTDDDGLSDYDEINKYKSDPTKYSTADDGISDLVKAERDLKFDRKYTSSEVKPEEIKYNYNILLKPEDLESQYYGGIEEYENDLVVASTYKVFDMLNFKGTVEYETNNTDSILLLREGTVYTEFKNYENQNGKLIITIKEEDNYKDFVITTKENYENYKSQSSEDK